MSDARITLAEAHARMKAQEVKSPRHFAFRCPVCGTVQSMASLVAAGADPARVERSIAFSCEGRFRDSGPWPGDKDKSRKAAERRKVRGCDWTLGGLFSIHKLEIEYPDGKVSPSFEIASPEEAMALHASLPKGQDDEG